MSNNDYKIELGVKLEDNALNSLNKSIGVIEKSLNPIKIDIDKSYITGQINDIKSEIQNLGTGTNNKKNKIPVTIDTESLEKSLSGVTETIKDIRNSLGVLDSKSGMKSLLSSINQISNALEKVSNQFDGIVSDLKNISAKDFNINFGLKFGGGNQVANNALASKKAKNEIVPQLKKQINDYISYLNSQYNMSISDFNTEEALLKLSERTQYIRQAMYHIEDKNKKNSLFYRMNDDTKPMEQMRAYREYINLFNEIAKYKKIDLSTVASGFSKTPDELIDSVENIKAGVNEADGAMEKLKGIFGGNDLNVEGISQQLDSIVVNLGEIKTAIQDLSKGISIDGLTASFDKLSDTLVELITNAKLVQNTLDTGLSGGVSQGLKNDIGILENFKQSLKNIGMGDEVIDSVSNRIKNLGVQIEMLNQQKSLIAGKKGDKEILSVDISGVDKFGNAIALTEQYDVATGKLIKSVDKVATVQQKVGVATNKFAKQQKNAVVDFTNTINQLNRNAIDKNASRAIKDDSHLDNLKLKYNEIISAIQRMDNASDENTFQEERNNVKRLISEYRSLTSEYRNAENAATSLRSKDINTAKDTNSSKLDVLISKMKKDGVYSSGFEKGAENLRSILANATDTSGLNEFLNGLDKLEAGYKRATAAKKEFIQAQKVGINVSGAKSEIADMQRASTEIDKFETEINGAKVTIKSLLSDLDKVNTQGDFSVVNSKLKAFVKAAKAAGIAVEDITKSTAEVRTKLAEKIKLKIDDKDFANDISKIDTKFNNLSNRTAELSLGIDKVKNALSEMEMVASADDEIVDIERLINLYEEYEHALKNINNQLDIQARKEKEAYNSQKLDDNRQAFMTGIDAWLSKNSAAVKKFGAQMLELKAQAKSCDQQTLNHLVSEFKRLDRAAEAAGKKTQSLGDKIKSQFSKYSQYLSIASVFNYAQMAMRDMFNQVVAIDSAMTELKKVTDETDASYNRFLSNAADRAKEIGTTIDGLVDSTADFARLGYNFKDSQGLAEVANIYAVVGDEVEGVEGATESLISTMAAFKNETNGLSNTDFAMSIIDKYNEIGNKFAITSGGIGEALERSASSLNAANNSMDESIALITAANTVVQNPDKVGNAFKTISMRIRGAKTELEDAGESTDGMVDSTAKLRQEVLALSGVDIMLDKDNFKSTYQVMDELSQKWEDLSDIAQASIIELMAGKHQGNVFASLMSNFDIARDALKVSAESSGSAMKEHEKWSQSLEAHLLKLKAAWQSLSQTFMDSDLLKGGIKVITVLIELIDKLIDNIGLLGTVGLGVTGTSIFKYFTKGSEIAENITDAVSAVENLGDAFDTVSDVTNVVDDVLDVGDNVADMSSAVSDASVAFSNLGGVATKAGGGLKAFMKTPLGVASAIGVAVAAIGLLYNAYKNYKESISEARQETIRASDEFLESSLSFEKAYIKYSGKTSLTSEEESELESAINGTVEALDDKSSALQKIVDGSNDYLTSLEQIKDAELDAASSAAETKREKAELELKDTVKGWTSFDGSEVNVTFSAVGVDEDNKAYKIAEDVGEKYFTDFQIIGNHGKKQSGFELDANADIEEIVDYYYMLLEYQKKLEDADLIDTTEYNNTTKAIEKMAEAVGVYTDGVYDAVKAQYQLDNGIPKTTEEYLKMRESILSSMSDKSVDTRKSIANTLDSEYGQVFDLTTTEAQARKFVGLINGYGNGTKDGSDEIGTVETFLNMRTAVNGNECTVGQYMSEFDKVNAMTKDWSEDEKNEFNSSFGLDTDSIKKNYDEIYKYLYNKNISPLNEYENTPEFRINKDSIKDQEISDFLDSLSASELQAVVNLKTELDWENDDWNEILKQIEEEAELVEAISFSINLDLETEKLTNLSTAISESISGAGLGTESMSLVEDMFGDLDSYDPSKLFERTANGIRLNSDELRKLNDEYKNTNVDGLDNKIDALGERYLQTREELSDLTYGTDEYNQKAKELSSIEAQINATETLMAQYEGLTSAYQTWQRAESAGSQRDMYESMIEGLENVDDEISRGWLDDGTIEFLRLIKGDTLSATATTKELKDAYKSLDDTIKDTTYSVRDFFTVDEDGNSTNDGVYNFLDAIGQLEEEKFGGKDVVKRDKNETPIAFDFQIAGGDKAIADALGISEELVQIMVRAADDVGFVVSMDGTYQQLDILKEKAQNAANELKNTLKVTEYEFDLNTGDEGSVLAQYDEALKIWEKFKKNKTSDGTVDMSVEGAEEAFTLVSTLQSMVDKLSEPVYMDIDASQVEKDMQTPLGKLQEYERLVQSEHQLELKGTDTSKIEEDKDKIIDYFENLDPEIQAELGLKNLTRDEIEKKLEAGEIEIPATVDLQVEMNNTMRDMVNVALYNAGIIDKEELETRVDVTLYANEVDASEVVNDIDSVLEESDLSEEKKVTIKAFAEVFGVDNIDDLSERLDKLDDEQIQVVANVIGRINVDALKTAIDGIEDKKKVEAIATAIGKGDVDDLKTAVNNLEGKDVEAIAKAFGYDDVESLKGAINNLTDKDVQAIATALGITDVDSLKGAIDRLTDKDVKAVANVEGKDDVNSLQSSIDGLKGKTVTIWAQVKKIASNLWGKITGSDEGGSGANGTANVNGTAFRQGSWGTKNSGTALVGELGRETLVRNGKYYTIGDNGAEFIKYQKGDIIFNHKQTEELFKNGRVTSGGGRAKALVGGTAFVKGTAFGDGSTGYGGTGRSRKGNSVTGKSYGKSSDSDDFEETIDWIETAIDRIERAIDQLDTKANSIYRTWSERNKNLVNEISNVEDEIVLQQKAYDEYIRAANAVGLSSSYASKVRNGTIDIETITDEVLKEKIDDYQTWYEKALACKDAILELKETESELYKQRFDNVASQYDGILGVIEHEKNMLEEYINQSEAQAWLVSANYYNALASNEKNNIAQLKKEKAAMLSELQNAMESGTIAKNSEAWFEMISAIDEVTLSITESETQLKEYAQTIQQLSWETFDLLHEKISGITEETEFLVELMSNDKLFDDNGQLTDKGSATMGLHGVAYNVNMAQADKYAVEAERLEKELAKDPYDTELEERYREMISLQREHILAAEDEKEAIRDMVEEGIELELDALQERIDKYNEALDSQKDLYDYQKNVLEQTKEIASLEKQIAAYSGDTSEEAKSKIQELKVSLEEAKTELQETEYEKYISDQQQLLDELYLEYENVLNTRLDNVNTLISDMIAEINTDASTISTTLSEKADSVGYALSDSMSTIWDTNSTKINSVITTYGEKFSLAQTTTNNALSTINTNLQKMITQLNTLAKTNVKSASTSSASNSKEANAKKKEETKKTNNTTTTNTTKAVTVGGMVNASGAKIYDYAGDTSGESQYYGKDPKYKVLKTDGNWIQVRWHKLSSGVTGWFKKGDVKAYKTGKKNILDSDVAWTQENGTEFIVRPSDGAILTPLAKGDSVLNAQASSNIWKLANAPADFIKDNLNLGAEVPSGSNVQNSYVQNLDNVVFNLPNVKNYDELVAMMQKDKNFEKLIHSMSVDRLAGKSSLAKKKIIK